MARIRTIKPEFFYNEQIASVSVEARLLFIGSWVFADDRGRHPLSERAFKLRVYPGDEWSFADIRRMFDELIKAKLIEPYVVDGVEYFYITGFAKHQKIDRPQPPKYPQPPTPSSPDRIGKDRIGKENKKETPISPPAPSGSILQNELPLDEHEKKQFELIWEVYAEFGDKASSKFHARHEFRKLTDDEREGLFGAVIRYGRHVEAERKRTPSYRVRHLDTFIAERVFESFPLPIENEP